MATTCITDRCRQYSWQGNLDFENDTHNMALYNGSGHGFDTLVYSATSEATGTGYVAKGNVLTGNSLTLDGTNHVAYMDWNDTQWTSSTITATDCLIYADSVTSDPALYVGDFGGSRSTSAGTFEVRLPVPAYNTAIMRFA
jgi:hypothetical protein